MRTLHLNLKEEFFNQIKGGHKRTEYRAVKPYWTTRLTKHFDFVKFKLGYARNAPFMIFEIESISIIDISSIHRDLLKTSKSYAISFKNRIE